MYGRLGSSYLARATSAGWKVGRVQAGSALGRLRHGNTALCTLPHPNDLPVSSSLFQRVSASNSLFRFARTRHRNNGRLLPDPPLWAESHTQLRVLSGPSSPSLSSAAG